MLWKYVELDTTLAAGSDTVYKIVLTYDGLKRVQHVEETASHNNQYLGRITRTYQTDYFYNSNDTLPFRTNSVSNTTIAGGFKTVVYYFYQNGFVISDSLLNTDMNGKKTGSHITTYAVSGDTVFYHSKDTSFNSSTPPVPSLIMQLQGRLVTTVQNRNIIAQKKLDINGSNYNRYEISYDNKTNPFRRVIIPYPAFESYGYPFGTLKDLGIRVNYNAREAQHSNVTEIKAFLTSAEPVIHRRYSYEYRNNGYPRMVRVTDIAYSDHRKGFYFYTK
jgi:hypothetical protein